MITPLPSGCAYTAEPIYSRADVYEMIRVAVRTEREACAQLADSTPQEDCGMVYSNATHIGTKIRERKGQWDVTP
jgi:hypothetical protein